MLNEVCNNIKAAIIHGRTDILRSVLEACENNENYDKTITKHKLLNTPLMNEGTFLLFATQLDQVDVVRNLLSNGADPAVCNAYSAATSDTMKQIYVQELFRAAANSEITRVGQLLNVGIYVNSIDSSESMNTPLHWAVCYGSSQVVSYLISRGADVNKVNSNGATPLHDAVARGDISVIEELLKHSSDVNVLATKGKFANKTPLDLSIDKPEILQLLNSYKLDDAKTSHEANHHDLLTNDNVVSSGDDGGVGTGVGGRRRHCSETQQLNNSVGTLKSFSSSLEIVPRIDQLIEDLSLKSPVKPLITIPHLHLLWPQPQKVLELPGVGFTPQKQLHISVTQGSVSIHSVLDVWEMNRPALLTLGYQVKIGDVQPSTGGGYTSSPVECCINENLFNYRDTYQMHISSQKVHMTCNSLSSLHYCVLTFIQLLKLHTDTNLPRLLIQDYPTLRHRGVLLDTSLTGRIPNLEYLFSIIDTLSSIKLNYLHLYTRLSPSTDWQLCYSKSEMIAIDRRCQDHFITLVPVLDVGDHVSLDNLDSMWPVFHEILTCFPNLVYVHVGPRLSALLAQMKEIGEDLEETTSCSSQSVTETVISSSTTLGLQRLCCGQNVTIFLCANSLHNHAGLQCNKSLVVPRNVVLVEYGFQADYDFRGWSKELQLNGGITCFCSGTASWNSLAGCPEAAIYNIVNSVQCAVEENVVGIIVAHWSGSHHLTPHPFSLPGFLVASGLSWNNNTPTEYLHSYLGELLNLHVLQDTSGLSGQSLLELGYIETYLLRCSRCQASSDVTSLPDQEGSTLYKLLTDPDNVTLEHLTPEIFNRVTKQVKRCQKELLSSKLESLYGEMTVQETMLSTELMLTACRIGRSLLTVGVNPNSNMGLAVINVGVHNLPPTFRTDIANKLLSHIEQLKGTWLQRHLPAGLQTSLLVLTAALHRFMPNEILQ